MLNKQTKIILAIGIQILVILIMILFKASILTGGTNILLRIEPVDPRDPLRGDYVTFQYGISNIPSYYVENYNYKETKLSNGQNVYVVLDKSGKYWEVGRVETSIPKGEEIFLKGRVEMGGVDIFDPSMDIEFRNDRNFRVKYGIEEYFIPEGVGRTFNFWDKEAAAQVSVDQNGNAVLKQIYIDDKPWP
jgi:uncharacterized membrane-anchored protein